MSNLDPLVQSSLVKSFKKETFNKRKWNQFKSSLHSIKSSEENAFIPNFQSLLQLLIELNSCLDIENYFEDASIANYFINDVFPLSARSLIKNKKFRNDQLQDIVNSYLKELLFFWLKTIHEDNIRLSDMARVILDPSRSYYEAKKPDEQESSIIPNFMNEPSKEHLEWIQALKQGDLVDSIKIDKHHNKMYWSPGKIEEVSDLSVKINFLNDSKDTSRCLDKKVNANEIALFNTKCKDFDNSSNQDCLSDGSNDKICDQEGMKFYVVPRDDYCISPFFINLVNQFGRLGGFEKLNERIQEANNGKKDIPLDFVLCLCCIMGNLSPILHQDFAVEFIPRFREAVWKYVLSRSDLTKYKIDRIIRAFHSLLSRIYSQQEKQQIIENFKLQVCLSCLDSELLELTGLTTLLEFIKDLENPTQTLVMTDTFQNEYISKNPILSKIYGLKCHVQVLKYMLEENIVSQQDFELMWTLTVKGQTKLAIYKVLKAVITHLKDEHIEYIIAHVADITPGGVSTEEIALLYEGYRSSGKPIRKKAKNFYWQIILNKAGSYQRNVVRLAIEGISEIMKNADFQNEKINVIYDCINNIKERISVLASLKLMKRLINQYPDNQDTGDDFSKETCLEHLAEDKNLPDILTKEFKNFKSSLKSQTKKGAQASNEQDLDAIVQEKSSYIDHIIERVEFAEFVVLNISIGYKNETDQLLRDIWDITVTNALIPNERDVMYKWIDHLSEPKQRSRAAFRSLVDLFNRKMNFNTSYTPETTRIEDFECVEQVFLAINKDPQKISKKAKVTDREFEYTINVMPHELEGINCIWEFALLPENDKVAKKASRFLKNLYRNIDKELESSIIKIRQKYIETCIRNLEKAIKNQKKLSASVFTTRSARCLKLISSIMDESEKTGLGTLKPHCGLVKGELLTLNFQNYPEDTKIRMYSNAKVIDFLVQVAKKYRPHWDRQARYWDQRKLERLGKEIKFNKNGRTLKEIGFKENETLYVRLNQIKEAPLVPLLMPDKTLNPLFKRILFKWFHDFSEDGKMSREHCGAFISSCTNRECQADDSSVRDIFEGYDDDNDGYLTESNFVEFYLKECQQRPRILWNYLRAHSYRSDLKTDTEVAEGVDISSLARYIISSNDEHFGLVFSLLELGGQIATEAWKILIRLPTNLEIFSEILTLKGVKDNHSGPNWNIILDLTSKHKLSYALYIMEFLLETDPNEAEESIRKVAVQDFRSLDPSIVNSSKSWQFDFISLGGFDHLVKILSLYTDKEDFSNLDAVDKAILSTVLKIFKNYLCVSFAATSVNQTHCHEILYNLPRNFFMGYLKPSEITPLAEETQRFNAQVHRFKDIIGSKLLSTINLKGLLDTILLIGYDILSKSESLEQEDCLILEYSLSTIISSLFFDGNSMKAFLSRIKQENEDSRDQICEKFILEGMLCSKEVNIRKYFAHTIYAFCVLSTQPGNLVTSKYFLDFLMKYLLSSTENRTNKNFNQFFELVLKLIEEITCNPKNSQIFSDPQGKLVYFNNLFIKTFERLQSHISSENRCNPNIQDQILIGLLSVCEKNISILHSIGSSLYSVEYNLIEEIFDTCLFDCRKEEKTSNNVKCYNDKSRSKAYKLFIALFKDNSACTSTMQKRIKDLRCLVSELKPSKGYSRPSARSLIGYVTIKNLGSIGYMNAIVQQLFMNSTFRDAMLSANDMKEFNEEDMISGNDDDILCQVQRMFGLLERSDDILYQLQKMFGFLRLNDKSIYSPEGFCSAFKNLQGLPTNVSVQEDAHEFLIRLFDKLEQRLDQTSSKNLLKDIYKGTIINQFVCGVCGTRREQEDTFYTLTVPVEKKKTLEDSLKHFAGQYYISDCFCEICKNNTEFTTKAQLSDLPHVLPIHLQRVSFDFDTMQSCKINTRFEFPLTLNVESYCKKPGTFSPPNEYYEYKLVGIVMHYGNANSGRYFSYIRDNNVSNNEDRWLEFIGSDVIVFNLKDIATEWFGETIGTRENDKNAYMLFYERILQPEVKPDSNHDNLPFEEKSIKRNISPTLSKNIEEDNRRFMLETQICTSSFYNFLNEFCEIIKVTAKVPISNELKESIEHLIHIQTAVFFQLQENCNDELRSQTISSLKNLLSLSPEMAWFVFDPFIQESHKIQHYFIHYGPQSRLHLLRITVFVINLLISHYKLSLDTLTNEEQWNDLTNEQRHLQDINEAVIEFLDTLVQWIPIQVSNRLTHSTEFFQFWSEFSVSGESQMNYLYRKNFVATLISFYLCKDSPVPELSYDNRIIPNLETKPSLRFMTQIISNMVRRSKTDTRTGTLPFTSLARKRLATYDLSPNDLKCLSCSRFYEQVLKWGLGCLGPIIQHLCFENESFSKMFAKAILKYLDYPLKKRYLDAMSYFVTLKDTLQLKRIEWIFGYPKPVLDTVNEVTYVTPFEKCSSLINTILRPRSEYADCELCVLSLKQMIVLMGIDCIICEYILALPPPSSKHHDFMHWISIFVKDLCLDLEEFEMNEEKSQVEARWKLLEKKIQAQSKFRRDVQHQAYSRAEISGPAKSINSSVIASASDREGDESSQAEDLEIANQKNLKKRYA